jgi:hypothetical protein
VAKTLVFYAKTARYDFKIYDLGTTYQDFDFTPPVEIGCADWNIQYQPQDSVLPGIVPSTCTAQFYPIGGTPTYDDFRTVFFTSTPDWVLEVHEGLNVVWRGFITADLGEIEVTNGERFVKITATDGFQFLDKKADYFTQNTVLSFTKTIAQVFTFCQLINLFEDGFYISEHYQPTNTIAGFTNQGGMFVTGTTRNGLIFSNLEPKSSRQVLLDICTAFNLQLFQDKGSLIFRSCQYETPAWYNLYDSGGLFTVRITPPATTVTPVVYSDGVEMYKPANAETRITTPYVGSAFIWYEPTDYQAYDAVNIGSPVSDGTTEIDFNGSLRARYSLPAFYPPTTRTITFKLTYKYNGYYWTGTAWSTTLTTIDHVVNFLAENPSPDPAIFEETHTVNNYKLKDLPAIGSEPFYFTVAGTGNVGSLTFAAQATFQYKAGAPTYVTYIADNTSRVTGITLELATSFTDIAQSGSTVLNGSIRWYASAASTTGNGNANTKWGNQFNQLIEIVANQIARKAYRTQQYYELELDGNISYNHTFNWGGVDYKAVNLQMLERSTRVTYREFIDGNLLPSD